VRIANGLGVPAVNVDSGERFAAELERAIAEPGPHLIEAVVPSVYSGFKLRAMPYGLRALEKLPRPLARAAKSRFYP
jgi:acetolactate synthase-1/2/3 large subunit